MNAKRRERVADANARLKENKSMACAVKMFNDGITSGPVRKKVSKISQSGKVIVNTVETNRKRY